MANVANQITFVDKQPNGYSYVDFMGKKVFQTLRFLKDVESTEISRNGGEAPTLVFVSKEYFESTIASEATHSILEITDDKLSLAFFRVAEYLTGVAQVPQNLGAVIEAGKTEDSYLVAKIVATKPYSKAGEVVESEVRGYIITKEHLDEALA